MNLKIEAKETIGDFQVERGEVLEERSAYFVKYSCDQTRLELLEYDSNEQAQQDYRLIVRVLKDAVACFNQKTAEKV